MTGPTKAKIWPRPRPRPRPRLAEVRIRLMAQKQIQTDEQMLGFPSLSLHIWRSGNKLTDTETLKTRETKATKLQNWNPNNTEADRRRDWLKSQHLYTYSIYFIWGFTKNKINFRKCIFKEYIKQQPKKEKAEALRLILADVTPGLTK